MRFRIGIGKMNKLKKWAVIDIETTGIDPAYDQIIDLGFLQFEGTKLVRSYYMKYSWLSETLSKIYFIIQEVFIEK